MRAGLIISVVTLAVAATTACSGPGNDYSGYTTLPTQGWPYNDSIRYDIGHTDSLATGSLIVSLRYAHDYAWRNIWLEVTTMADNNGTVDRRDTLTIDLRDKYGRPQGHGIGVSFQLSDTVAHNVTHRSGTPVYVRHIMRADTLAGIEQIGISFVENQ